MPDSIDPDLLPPPLPPEPTAPAPHTMYRQPGKGGRFVLPWDPDHRLCRACEARLTHLARDLDVARTTMNPTPRSTP